MRATLLRRDDIRSKFERECVSATENQRQRDKLQWALIERSRVRRVPSAVRDLSTFTNPAGFRTLPPVCACDAPAAKTKAPPRAVALHMKVSDPLW